MIRIIYGYSMSIMTPWLYLGKCEGDVELELVDLDCAYLAGGVFADKVDVSVILDTEERFNRHFPLSMNGLRTANKSGGGSGGNRSRPAVP